MRVVRRRGLYQGEQATATTHEKPLLSLGLYTPDFTRIAKRRGNTPLPDQQAVLTIDSDCDRCLRTSAIHCVQSLRG